jgi:L-malate glycosyltransferase
MAFNLLSELSARPDLSLSAVLLNEGRLARELRAAGVSVRVFDECTYSFIDLIGKVREVLKKETPEIVHAHRYKENLIALMASFGLGKTRLVATQHGLPETPHQGGGAVQALKTRLNFFLLSRFFAKTVAVSRDIGEHLVLQYGIPEKKVAVIHNGVPMPISGSGQAGTHSDISIGSSGRLFPVKDYPLMVQVAALVAPRHEVRFLLAGEGGSRGEIEALIADCGLKDSFTLLGHLGDMDAFYRGLSIYLNTSLHEGIPMTILEAMARGVPVIAPDVGGISEILEHGVQGFLVQGRAPADFAARCLELIENNELRSAMARAARERANGFFSAEQMANGYRQLYLELLAS